MKFEKKLLSDGRDFTSYQMDIIYDDDSRYSYNFVKDKTVDDLYYSLYQFENSEDASYSYKFLVKLLKEKYAVKVFSFYYDEIDSYYCEFKLDDVWIRFIYDCEVNHLSLNSVNKMYNENFMDELSVYVVYNLIENLAKKKSLGK